MYNFVLLYAFISHEVAIIVITDFEGCSGNKCLGQNFNTNYNEKKNCNISERNELQNKLKFFMVIVEFM